MATAMGLRSLSRLRRRVGAGVPPRFTLFVWREFPPPASRRSMQCDLPRKREKVKRGRELTDSTKLHPTLEAHLLSPAEERCPEAASDRCPLFSPIVLQNSL
jgi:hypothetical protein